MLPMTQHTFSELETWHFLLPKKKASIIPLAQSKLYGIFTIRSCFCLCSFSKISHLVVILIAGCQLHHVFFRYLHDFHTWHNCYELAFFLIWWMIKNCSTICARGPVCKCSLYLSRVSLISIVADEFLQVSHCKSFDAYLLLLCVALEADHLT